MEKPMIQPNKVTDARYEFSAVQKNIIYHLIGELQNKMTRDETLFGEQIFDIPLKNIDHNDNYSRIKKEIDNLRVKAVEYEYRNENGKQVEVVTCLVAGYRHEHNNPIISLVVPSFALPFLCQIEKGFTQYRKTIAISLRSKHSKRLYELCCKYISGANAPGGFKKSIKELKAMFYLENKYPKPGLFDKNVLKVAHKELKENADVWFEYTIHKQSKGEYYVNFKLFTSDKRHKSESVENTSDWFSYTYRILSQYVFGVTSDKAQTVTEELEKKGGLRNMVETLKKLVDRMNTGEIKGGKHMKNTILSVLRDDFDMNYTTKEPKEQSTSQQAIALQEITKNSLDKGKKDFKQSKKEDLPF